MPVFQNFILSILLISFSTYSHAQAKPAYKIISHIKLQGDGGWDYLTMDEASGLLYVSHGAVVQVVDVKTGKQVAVISDTKGVHGIAIASELGKGYISCGRDSSVVIFDLKTFKTINKVTVKGANPDAILYDPFSKNVFVFNGRTANASVLDAGTDGEIATIPLSGKPEFSVSDNMGNVYVNIEDKSELCKINTTTLKVETCWPVAPAEEPSGLAMDLSGHHLFTVSDGHMVVMDAASGKVLAALKIGGRVDGVAYDPGLKRAYSANGDGTISVVQQDGTQFKLLENIITLKGARTIAIDTHTHHLYLPVADLDDAPAADKQNPHPRPKVKKDSFQILEIAPAD